MSDPQDRLTLYPYVKKWLDRHGKTRWRYRRKGITRYLPGAPGSEEFAAAYQIAIGPVQRGNRYAPCTFGHAWKLFEGSAEFATLGSIRKRQLTNLAMDFLATEIGEGLFWRDAPVKDLRRRHIKALLAETADRPHRGKHMLSTLRKMISVALDEEWIEFDPATGVKWRPGYKGWRAWTAGEMVAFQKAHKPGTRAHIVYCLALWLGNRRCEIPTLRWEQRTTRIIIIGGEKRIVPGFELARAKNGVALFIPEAPMLTEALQAAPRNGETILAKPDGRAGSAKVLSNHMAKWTEAAGIGPGCTIHGLRKTLGNLLAEGGASTRQLMDVLGHSDMQHAELYSRTADQARMATEAMDKVIHLMDNHENKSG